MKLLSVNVGLPREIEWKGNIVRTSIFKAPAPGRVRVRKLNLDGDQQSDLAVHGGIDKAVYACPWNHYAFWRQELPVAELPWGVFGENLITEGLLEETLHIGDRLRVGSSEFVVAAGDATELLKQDEHGVTVVVIARFVPERCQQPRHVTSRQ